MTPRDRIELKQIADRLHSGVYGSVERRFEVARDDVCRLIELIDKANVRLGESREELSTDEPSGLERLVF
jgi:hypothetical protein